MNQPTILVTGASGQLGRLVVEEIVRRRGTTGLIAGIRDEAKGASFEARGVAVRVADYERSETLARAFAGVDRLVLISSNEIGRRESQHRAAIDAARGAGIRLIAYTSILHAPQSPLTLADEHRATEAYLRSSGIPHVLLRNGWYTENFTAGASASVAQGAVLGSSGDGRYSTAPRADYAAAAAAVVLAADDRAGRIYELAGDEGWTMSEFAAELAAASGRPVAYRDLPEAAYAEALVAAGLPAPYAAVLADSSARAASGALFDGGRELSDLIERPTEPLALTVRAALARRETAAR